MTAVLWEGLSILHSIENRPVQVQRIHCQSDSYKLDISSGSSPSNTMYKRRRNDSQSSDEDVILSVPKRIKKPSFVVKNREMTAFFRLLEDPHIYSFIEADICKLITDKYLLAMVFAYFKRASINSNSYDRMNFFVALYLACDMEEDEEEYKYEIFPWALGSAWRVKYMKFLRSREKLWSQIGYRAVVSRKCCDEIMRIEPNHWAWQRVRPEHHAGAVRSYMHNAEDEGFPRGPGASPRVCKLCGPLIEYDSASPASTTWYLSSSTESSPDILNHCHNKSLRLVTTENRFNMSGLKHTLDEDEGIWACMNEP